MSLSLPERTRRERDMTRNVRERTARYPFAVFTPGTSSPTPKIVEQTGITGFYRQPYGCLNGTVWLFGRAEDREQFLGVYIGEPVTVE